MRRLSRLAEADFPEEETWMRALEFLDDARDFLSRAYRDETQQETKARYEAALDHVDEALKAMKGRS